MNNPKFYSYDNIKLGRGSFDLPPVLIGTIFYQNEIIVDRKNNEIFNIEKAKKRIDTQISLSEKYKIPNLIEISALTPKAMITYLEFYLDNYEPPFVLGGNFESRIAGIEYLADNGIKPDRYIYNAISNLKNKEELQILKKCNVDSVVVLMLGSNNMTATQRFAYLTENTQPNNSNILKGLKNIGIKKIWIDGGVNELESLAHILETQKLISVSLELPVGTAPNNILFQYSSPRLNVKFHTRYRRASIVSIATWFSNFIFYGAIEDAKESFASAKQSFELKTIIQAKKIKLFE